MSIKDRGFASMSRKKRQAIAAMGGRAAHAKGTAHKWTKEEARAAGSRGGKKQYENKLARRQQETSAPDKQNVSEATSS